MDIAGSFKAAGAIIKKSSNFWPRVRYLHPIKILCCSTMQDSQISFRLYCMFKNEWILDFLFLRYVKGIVSSGFAGMDGKSHPDNRGWWFQMLFIKTKYWDLSTDFNLIAEEDLHRCKRIGFRKFQLIEIQCASYESYMLPSGYTVFPVHVYSPCIFNRWRVINQGFSFAWSRQLRADYKFLLVWRYSFWSGVLLYDLVSSQVYNWNQYKINSQIYFYFFARTAVHRTWCQYMNWRWFRRGRHNLSWEDGTGGDPPIATTDFPSVWIKTYFKGVYLFRMKYKCINISCRYSDASIGWIVIRHRNPHLRPSVALWTGACRSIISRYHSQLILV